MTKMFKVLGKRGRVTIPLEVREELGYSCNDILSFTAQDNGTLLIKKEKICDNCIVQLKAAEEQKKDSDSIMELLDSLTDSQQRYPHSPFGEMGRKTIRKRRSYG